MRVLSDKETFREFLDVERAGGRVVGFVPTMGFLHEGHATLMRRAKQECDVVAASIFVNPLQFGANEDLDAYPRDDARDDAVMSEVGVDFVLRPQSAGAIYDSGPRLSIDVGPMGEVLCGASRPGHFNGVATVVAKLFNIAGPCKAYFGQKDAQQLVVIRRLVSMFDFPVEVIGCPTVREADGLAMSSRNSYLSPKERSAATILYSSLADVAESVEAGETSVAQLVKQLRLGVASESLARIDYVACVDPESLEPIEVVSKSALFAVAAWFGDARLIDNLTVTP